jgi:hypothetical protein
MDPLWSPTPQTTTWHVAGDCRGDPGKGWDAGGSFERSQRESSQVMGSHGAADHGSSFEVRARELGRAETVGAANKAVQGSSAKGRSSCPIEPGQQQMEAGSRERMCCARRVEGGGARVAEKVFQMTQQLGV